jgi:CheY-like chemotaxis protein
MILLLCSEPVVRSVMKEVLQNAGYIVLATGSLGVAVDMLAQSKIDLLITYPYIDNITGHEAAKYLRAKNPRMEILVVAGLLDDKRLQHRADLEGFEIFPPPFTAAQLIGKVEEGLKAAQERPAQHISRLVCDNPHTDSRKSAGKPCPRSVHCSLHPILLNFSEGLELSVLCFSERNELASHVDPRGAATSFGSTPRYRRCSASCQRLEPPLRW